MEHDSKEDFRTRCEEFHVLQRELFGRKKQFITVDPADQKWQRYQELYQSIF